MIKYLLRRLSILRTYSTVPVTAVLTHGVIVPSDLQRRHDEAFPMSGRPVVRDYTPRPDNTPVVIAGRHDMVTTETIASARPAAAQDTPPSMPSATRKPCRLYL